MTCQLLDVVSLGHVKPCNSVAKLSAVGLGLVYAVLRCWHLKLMSMAEVILATMQITPVDEPHRRLLGPHDNGCHGMRCVTVQILLVHAAPCNGTAIQVVKCISKAARTLTLAQVTMAHVQRLFTLLALLACAVSASAKVACDGLATQARYRYIFLNQLPDPSQVKTAEALVSKWWQEDCREYRCVR